MLQKLGGIRIGIGAIVLSIISLGMIDAIAMLPLSISATGDEQLASPWSAADRRRLRDRLLHVVRCQQATE
jgi:hypothetical protein